MKTRNFVVLFLVGLVLAFGFWGTKQLGLSWRWAVLQMKLEGRLEGMSWSELIAEMEDSAPLEFGTVTAFTGLRGLVTGQIRLSQLDKEGPCPALWETPTGEIWGRLSDENSLEALFIEQLQLQIYQNDLVNVMKGDVVFDVGSHLGTFTKLALLSDADLVVAFEPEPTNIRCFQRTFHEEIEDERVILIEAAVWDEMGRITFSSAESVGGSTAKVSKTGDLEVEAITLDRAVEDLELDRVDFVKMDIEGAERRALAGAQQLLREFGPRMALSTYHEPDDPEIITHLVLGARPDYNVVSSIGFAYFFLGSGAATGMRVPRSLLGLNRKGEEIEILSERGAFSFPRFSPKGSSLAFVSGQLSRDLWILSLEDGRREPLTNGGGLEWSPVWSPDSSQIAFSARQKDGKLNIYVKCVQGARPAERLTNSHSPQIVESWSSAGNRLAYSQLDIQNGSDIWTMPLDGSAEGEPFIASPYDEGWPRFSPDGQWLAYTSNQNGYLAVYVCPFPGPGREQQVSEHEGWYPRWGSKGRELFYRVGSRVMVVPIAAGGSVLEVGQARELFKGNFTLGFYLEGGAWDVTNDGERFVMMRDEEGQISLDKDSEMR